MKHATGMVTLVSRLHGERIFRLVGSQPYKRADGIEVAIKIWQGSCVVCDSPFEVTTPQGVTRAEQSRSFEVTTCPAHRLTSGEANKLRFAKPSIRKAVFAAIKANRMTTPKRT
jgi:hypothetical protein